MSKPDSPSGDSIPFGILVSATHRASKAEAPAPKRKSASAANQLPWLWIATGGCAAWIVVVLVVAVTNMAREPEAPAAPNPVMVANLGAVEPAFQAPANAPNPLNDAVEFVEPDAPPVVPVPKLPFPAAFEPVDEAPAFNVVNAPEVVRPEAPVVVKPVAPNPPAVPVAVVPPKNAVDKSLFADCGQIGTNVLFMRDPPAAFKRAKAEKNMVYVVHLSGNLEDKEFT